MLTLWHSAQPPCALLGFACWCPWKVAQHVCIPILPIASIIRLCTVTFLLLLLLLLLLLPAAFL